MPKKISVATKHMNPEQRKSLSDLFDQCQPKEFLGMVAKLVLINCPNFRDAESAHSMILDAAKAYYQNWQDTSEVDCLGCYVFRPGMSVTTVCEIMSDDRKNGLDCPHANPVVPIGTVGTINRKSVNPAAEYCVQKDPLEVLWIVTFHVDGKKAIYDVGEDEMVPC